MKLIKRLVHKLAMMLQKIEFGRVVTVYFPKEDMYEDVIVSGVRRDGSGFTGKFMMGEPAGLNVWESYGQADNDMLFNVKTHEVVDMKIGKFEEYNEKYGMGR